MPEVDLRPGKLDVVVFPGNPSSLNITWPAALTSRTFTAAVGETSVPAVVDDHTVTVTFSAAVTAAITRSTEWALTETTGVDSVLITGYVRPSSSGTGSQSNDLTVTLDEAAVTVTVLGAPGPAGEEGEGGGGGAVDSVNGETGVVVLSASDVGADPAGTAAGLVTTEATTRAAADTALDGRLDTIEAISIATDTELASAIAALSTVYQPLDSDLTAIAALTTTSYGRAFLALADAAAGRTALGLGTAATSATGAFDAAGSASAAQAASQPLDSDLTALAALTTTAYGRSLLEAANAAALRTLAGLGTAAVAATGDFDAAGSATAAQAAAVQRANHTGAQAISTVTGLQTALDAKAVDADVVHDTGAETIAGVKTFSSDPLIPDEVYGVGWNGSLEPPTKNAVYDKIETISSGADNGGRVSDETHATVTFATSTAENTLASLAIPTTVAAGDVLLFSALLDYLNNSGGAVNYTWRFKIGTTTVLATPVNSIATSANRRKGIIRATIHIESTAAQRVAGEWLGSGATTDTWPSGGTNNAYGYGTAAEDTTSTKNAILTCQMGTSAATADVRLHAASLVLMKK